MKPEATIGMIDFGNPGTEVIGRTCDLRDAYSPGEPGAACLLARDVVIDAGTKRHIVEDHDTGRLEFIAANLGYIGIALGSPEIIYRSLDYKPGLTRWAQVFAVEVPGTNRFMTVVVGLARADEPSDTPHRVLTIIDAGWRYFYGRRGRERGALKPKWKPRTP